MKGSQWVLLCLVLVMPAVAADNQYSIEDQAMGAVPDAVAKAVQASKGFKDMLAAQVECKLQGEPVTLRADRPKSGYLLTTMHACGWAASSGPYWLVAVDEQGARVVLDTGGYAITVLDTQTHGYHDLRAVEGDASGGAAAVLKFDGKQYVETKVSRVRMESSD
ncbi:hypothetical protein [Dyella sp.]|uniref:hypothetical protein n=1 Tax=Dyella sp. TaxID=1869338 RepID=UPI002ED2D831